MLKAATQEFIAGSRAMSDSINIDFGSVKKAAGVLRAINHHLRQSMLQLIGERGSLTVTELYHAMGLEQSVASQHLAILRKAGVVETSRDGKYIYYSVNGQRLKNLEDLSLQIIR